MAIPMHQITLRDNDDGRRLDRILKKIMPRLPIGRMYRALRSREIRLNGGRGRPDTRVASGDVLEIADYLGTPESIAEQDPARKPDGLRAGAETGLSDRIVFENDHILVINKRRGELAHGPDSLEDAVRAYASVTSEAGVSFRPGPINRIDRNTSGIILYAKTLRGAQAGAEALQAGALRKYYLAVLDGDIGAGTDGTLVWDNPLERDETTLQTRTTGDGAAATTYVRRLAIARGREHSLAEIRIATGRTHQIRTHASVSGHPVTGDRKYGSRSKPPYLLHAWRVERDSTVALAPRTDASLEFAVITAPPPDAFLDRVRGLFGPDTLSGLGL